MMRFGFKEISLKCANGPLKTFLIFMRVVHKYIPIDYDPLTAAVNAAVFLCPSSKDDPVPPGPTTLTCCGYVCMFVPGECMLGYIYL